MGEIVYTQWLNERGTLEADLTITQLAEDKFMVVATDTAHRHVESHMARHFGAEASAVVTDVTGAYTQLNIQGPHSRTLMSELTDTDMSDEAFPFRAAKEVALGYARPMVTRITYLGELGYELFIPSEQALHVYDKIVAVGEGHGLVHAGLKALASLRMEKGYRDYGHDLDNTDTLLEAGLGFTADFDKPGGFIGREAVLAQKASVGGSVAKLPKRMIQVVLEDPEPFLHHGEVVYRDGEIVGDVRAGSFGHTVRHAARPCPNPRSARTIAGGGGPCVDMVCALAAGRSGRAGDVRERQRRAGQQGLRRGRRVGGGRRGHALPRARFPATAVRPGQQPD